MLTWTPLPSSPCEPFDEVTVCTSHPDSSISPTLQPPLLYLEVPRFKRTDTTFFYTIDYRIGFAIPADTPHSEPESRLSSDCLVLSRFSSSCTSQVLCLRNCQSISPISLRLNLLDTFPCGQHSSAELSTRPTGPLP
jgi:hypothetical protein